MIKMAQKKTKRCKVPICGKTQSLYRLPSDPNIMKEWMNFIFNQVPDHVSKNLVLCLLSFTDLQKELKDDALPSLPTILDLTIMLHDTMLSNCFYYLVTFS